MEYPIVNLLKLTNLYQLNQALGTAYKRVQITTAFDKQLEYHNMTEVEYKYYKRIMETPRGI